jgi:hypothetical protein
MGVKMQQNNNILEVRIQKGEEERVKIQLLDGINIIASENALAIPNAISWFGRGFGREIRRIKGDTVSENVNYIVTNNMVEQDLYEAFRMAINDGIQEPKLPDRNESQLPQSYPPWYKALVMM